VKRPLAPLLLVGAQLVLACAPLAAPRGAPPPRAPLDWSAAGRWVHVDHVDPAQAPSFEQARKRWLARLAQLPGWQPDGRPLFWSGTHGGSSVYVTFHPYSTWSDLAARAEAAAATNEAAGQEAVTDYDSGDQALVPPHRSELWRRLPEMDLGPAPGAPCELSSRRLLVELRRLPTGAAGPAFDEVWSAVQRALGGKASGVQAQAWWSAYGSGALVLLWSGADGAWPRGLSVLKALPGGAALLERAEALTPLEDRLELVRRDDLSNLP
jgi:hypothetical protein